MHVPELVTPQERMTRPPNPIDELLDELRELRLPIEARFGNDPDKYYAHLREFEQQMLREGWVEAPPPPKRDKSAA